MNRPQILEAVEALRQRKCRPEREAIASYILRKYGTQFHEIFSDLETVVDQGDLVKVEYKGSTSYRNPEAFDTKASPLLTKHSKILNSNRTVRFILSAVSELLAENDSYNKDGIPLEAIQTKLISYDSSRFTPVNVPTFIDREVAVGSLVSAPKQCVLPKYLNPLPLETDKKPAPTVRMRGRKPAAAATKNAETTPTTSAIKTEQEEPTEVFAVKSAPPLPLTPTNSKAIRSYGRKATAASAGKDKGTESQKSSVEEKMPSLQISAEESVVEGKEMPSLSVPDETGTTGGRSVRNKRKKEVFDPSDIPKKRPSVTTPTTVVVKQEKDKAPTATKATPTTPKTPGKRGRKKKQPDTSEEKKAVVSTLCDHCQRHKNIKGQFECFLICSDCLTNYHPSCLDYQRKQASFLIEKGTWQCSECKACQVCQEQSAKGPETILCSTCDVGFHYKCLELATKPAEDSWLCPACKGEVDQAKEPAKTTEEPEVKVEKVEVKEEAEAGDEPSSESEAVKKKPPVKAGRPPPKKRILTLKLEKKGDEGGAKVKDEKVTIQPVPVVTCAPATTTTTGGGTGTAVDVEPKDEDDDIPLDASKWTPSQVEAYFKKHGLREEGILFREQEIDGLSLLLMRRQDIVNGMKLLLGPALKIYKLVVKLQQSGGKVEESKLIL